jgi:Transcriptional Coactivator p15 (PC4)
MSLQQSAPKKRKIKEETDDDTVEESEEQVQKRVKVEREDDKDKVEEPEFEQESPAELKVHKNGDGESFLDLSPMRRVTVRMYRRKVLVDIREVSFPTFPESKMGILLCAYEYSRSMKRMGRCYLGKRVSRCRKNSI